MALTIALFISAQFVASAQEKNLDDLKKATAYVEIHDGESSGTAFCISKKGYYLTCAHVLEGLDVGGEVSLSLQPGLPAEKTVKAKIVRLDRGLDLALLKGPEEASPALTIGKSSSLRETDEVLAAGFPLGSFLRAGKGAPAVTITSGKVTAIRRKGENIDNVQIDAELNPGNSGGPVINEKGEVVGVAVSTILGTRLNFAIATDYIRFLMDSAEIKAALPKSIPFGERHQRLSFEVTLSYLRPPEEDPSIQAWFVGDSTGERELEVRKVADGKFTVTGVPVVADALGSSSILRGEFIRASGNIRHTQTVEVLDTELSVDGKPVPLSQISLVIPSRGLVRSHLGKEVQGTIAGLHELKVYRSGRIQPWDGSSYDALAFRPASVTQEKVNFRFEVRGNGMTTTFRTPVPIAAGSVGVVSFGNPSLPVFDSSAWKEPRFEGEQTEVKLRGQIFDAAWGGGGRYLVAHLRNKRILEVVDCLEGKTLGSIPVNDDNIAFGAGARQILVAEGDKVTHWNIDPLEKVGDPAVWVPGRILHLSIGAGATQVVGLHYDAFERAGLRRFELREFGTGRLIAIEPVNGAPNEKAHFRASYDGYVHGSFESATAGSSGTLLFPVGSVLAKDSPRGTGWICPGVDQNLFYTSSGFAGLRGYPESKVASWENKPLIPTTVAGIACRLPENSTDSRSSKKLTPYLDIVDVHENRALIRKWIELEELDLSKLTVERTFTREDPLTLDKRVFLSPQLSLLATLPLENRSVLLRKIDLWNALRDSKINFLHIPGAVPRHLKSGEVFSSLLKVESSSTQPIEFELLQGPDGMTISSEGQITWPTTTEVAGSTHRLLIRLSTKEGIERLWTHELTVH